jgi:ABC-type branched-subunit amino acid transport system substrate-binding protein
MQKYLTRVGLVLLLLCLVAGIGQAQSQPVFRIGVLDDARGPIANGARLAVKTINDSGGVPGADGTLFRLELIIQPTRSGAGLARAISEINNASVIAALGPLTTEEVLTGLTLLQGLNVPILTPALGDTILASDSTGLFFRTRAPEVLQGRALANYLVTDLDIDRVVTVQLDLNSTAAVIGFTTAITQIGVPPQEAILFESGMQISQLTDAVIEANPQIAAVYGPPDMAAQLYLELRAAGWLGLFAYHRAEEATFRNAVPLDLLEGILGTTTWPSAARDTAGNNFLNNFVRAFGYVPGPVEAASYDSVNLLAQAIGLPGDLRSNLSQLNNVAGVQGLLSPAQLGGHEMSNNVTVIQLGPLGGPQVNARYAGNQRLPDDSQDLVLATPAPLPTATPEGVVLTIKSSVQNVRTGPGTNYDVLGQMRRDEQARVIGATLDFSWVVIDYRGQQGWLSTSLLDIFGDRSTVPVVQPPPSPTPPPPTNTPPPTPKADILIVGATPGVITRGQPFTMTVTVQNIGTVAAGQFAVAATFPPDGVYSGLTLPGGLGAGQITTVNLTGTLNGATGIYTVAIIADLNLEVDEGPAGEANNDDFVFRYRLDRPVLNQGTLTINPGGTLSLEGAGTADVQWNATGTSLDFPAPPAGSGMYIMTGVASLNDVHYDLINTTLTNTYNLNVALLPNAFIAIVTAEGNRGVMHVDSVISGGAITLSYRVYQP